MNLTYSFSSPPPPPSPPFLSSSVLYLQAPLRVLHPPFFFFRFFSPSPNNDSRKGERRKKTFSFITPLRLFFFPPDLWRGSHRLFEKILERFSAAPSPPLFPFVFLSWLRQSPALSWKGKIPPLITSPFPFFFIFSFFSSIRLSVPPR